MTLGRNGCTLHGERLASQGLLKEEPRDSMPVPSASYVFIMCRTEEQYIYRCRYRLDDQQTLNSARRPVRRSLETAPNANAILLFEVMRACYALNSSSVPVSVQLLRSNAGAQLPCRGTSVTQHVEPFGFVWLTLLVKLRSPKIAFLVGNRASVTREESFNAVLLRFLVELPLRRRGDLLKKNQR